MSRGMMDRGAFEANMESAARGGYGKVAEQAARIAELEAGIRAALNMVDGNGMPPDWDALRKLVSKR